LPGCLERVVFREVRVAEHVRRDERVFLQRIVAREVSAPRVSREDDFEEPRVAHAVLNEVVDVPDAERPVRHPHGQAVDRDLHHEARRNFLELDWVVIEPLLARQSFEPGRVVEQRVGHVTSGARTVR
jgi:hypothetical protein